MNFFRKLFRKNKHYVKNNRKSLLNNDFEQQKVYDDYLKNLKKRLRKQYTKEL